MAYLPNKKILFLVVFILLIFAGWFSFSDYKNKQVQYIADKEKSPLAVALDTTSRLDADTDADGLKDWEELLWKTDPNKMDTDSDGTNDNEEITLNRNPLKAGPDDKISEKEDLVAQEKAVSDSKQNTLTAAYAKQFLTEYLLLKQQKGKLTEEDKNNLVEKFMGNIEPLVVVDKYKLSDLKISDEDSKEAVEKYAKEMKKIFIEDELGLIDDTATFEILMKNINDNNPEFKKYVEGLNYSISQYEELIEKLIILNIPKEFSKNHTEIINGFSNLNIALKNMVIADADPLKSMMGKKLYDTEITKIFNAINNIQIIFNKFGIKVF